MDQDLVQGATEQAAPIIGHPGINPKGDQWIIARLEQARRRNRDNDNPNLKRGRMVFDFAVGRVRIAEAVQ